NPLRLPGFVHLRSLEPGRLAFGAFTLAPHADLPVIARARRKLDRRAKGQAVDACTCDFAAVEDDLLEASVAAHDDLRGGLHRVTRVLDDPGKRRLVDGKAQRIRDAICLGMGNFHNIPREDGANLSLSECQATNTRYTVLLAYVICDLRFSLVHRSGPC